MRAHANMAGGSSCNVRPTRLHAALVLLLLAAASVASQPPAEAPALAPGGLLTTGAAVDDSSSNGSSSNNGGGLDDSSSPISMTPASAASSDSGSAAAADNTSPGAAAASAAAARNATATTTTRSSSGGAGSSPSGSSTDAPVTAASGPLPDNTVDLSAFPGCRVGGASASPYLPPGLDGSCTIQGVLGRRETDAFTFSLSPASNTSSRPFRVIVMLRSVDGAPQLGLSVPRGGPADATPEALGTQVYATKATAEVYAEVPWDFIAGSDGGRYVITVSKAPRRTLYTLQVLTPYDDVMLAPEDTGVMRDLYSSCCLAGDVDSPLCSQYLPAALAANRTADDDLCHMSPMTCNNEGHLTRLTLAATGLSCPAGLPPSLARLSDLATLDLAFNNISATLDDLGNLVSRMPSLQNLFVRYAELTGSVPCSLVAGPNIRRLSITGNNITGSLPACLLQSPSLTELYVSQTGLTGRLPDQVPPSSPLRVLFGINRMGAANTTSPRGFEGPLPASLLASRSLAFLNLAGHRLTGGLEALPPSLQLLNLSANALDGRLGPLPPGLVSFDVSFNALTGQLPALADLSEATQFDVQRNRFTGSLPNTGLPPNLQVFDVSGNSLGGPLPSQLPASLRFFDAADNSFGGSLPALPRGCELRFLLLSGNQLGGQLPRSLINGTCPLRFLDLGGNRLSGRLDGSTAPAAGSAGGRRLLQQQVAAPAGDAPAAGAAAAAPAAGAGDGAAAPAVWARLQRLGYLDLSANQLTGPVPAVLGDLGDLVYLDLASNALSGSLKPFADALAANANASSLMYLDVSDNRLSGNVPAGLSAAPLLDPSVRATLQQGVASPRVMDLSGNAFSGPFPSWAISQPPLVAGSCGGCDILLALNGSDMRLACPPGLELTPQQLPYVQQAGHECVNAAGQKVSLLSAAGNPSAAPAGNATNPASAANLADLSSPFYDPSMSSSSQGTSGGSGGGLSPGAIAGIVIGSVAGAAVLAAAALFGRRAARKRRAGWRREELDGGPFGVASLPPHLAASGAGAGAAGPAANGGGGAKPGAGDPVYPHTPIEATPYHQAVRQQAAGIEMLNSHAARDVV